MTISYRKQIYYSKGICPGKFVKVVEVDEFVCRLRQRAVSCDFGALEDEYIRDQLIDRCFSQKLRRKFLERDGSVSLSDLLKIARAQEAGRDTKSEKGNTGVLTVSKGLTKARKVVLSVVERIVLHGSKGVQLEVKGAISVGRLAILKGNVIRTNPR